MFDAPVKEFSHLHSGKKIDCLAVTDSLGASSSSTRVEENAILLWNVETGEVRRRLVGECFHNFVKNNRGQTTIVISYSVESMKI